ncbi:DNA polymerase III subunit chi [Methylomicrobium sp. Wu6]|uniref:DNA polymerase III subunit chi n=1 Tax=Methylomicrobium sp. Wu6 TaxID=3107928 RepID=UPI002DD6B8BE|nr:DNA polymerase III subunit chi [Methylomicrobium sp. Wu6]MEC4748684.1 DNA polymerase III subunit chi [Methylomicrobium sp. Wu6]
MPEVTFYVLASDAEPQRLLFACRLVEKVYRSGSYCYVLTDNDAQAERLDDLLWTFRAGSFIPHQRYEGELPAVDNVILIGSLVPPERWQGVIINLSMQGPQQIDRAERILEIIDDNPEIKAEGRLRYRRYQQSGIAVVTHDI